jgi:hypothetical protein
MLSNEQLARIAGAGANDLSEHFDSALAERLDDWLVEQKTTLGKGNATMLCVAANSAVQSLLEEGASPETCRILGLVYSAYIMGCFRAALDGAREKKDMH